MRKLLVCVVLFFSLGCSARQELAETCLESWRVIGSEYVEYVENDPHMRDNQKAIRIGHAEQLTKSLEYLAQ
jgi:hypothetical protein